MYCTWMCLFLSFEGMVHTPVSVWLQVQSIQAFSIYSRGDSAKDDIGQNNRFQATV